jgi:hypothetical protein
LAQQNPLTRIRGTIEAVDLPTLTVKSNAGEVVKVRIADNGRVAAMVKASVDNIKPNAFIGVTGIPAADGSERAYEVHIFPEEQRGAGEGRNPIDRGPNSMMTNEAVNLQPMPPTPGAKVQVEGETNQMLTQEAKIALTPETIITAYARGADRRELKPRINVTVQGHKGEDGSLEAAAAIYGRYGSRRRFSADTRGDLSCVCQLFAPSSLVSSCSRCPRLRSSRPSASAARSRRSTDRTSRSNPAAARC